MTYPISHKENGIAVITVPKSLYEAEALLQTAYKYSGSFYIIFQESGDLFDITLESKDGHTISDETVKEICNDFIDQQIRINTEKQFGHIRDIIVEEAFKPVNK